MKTLIMLVALLLVNPAKAADPLTGEQAALTVALGLVSYQDYKQTLDIKNHRGLYETNPILGKHPGDAHVRNYFVASSVATLVTLYVLPSSYRNVLLRAGLAVEFAVTHNNAALGLKGAF